MLDSYCFCEFGNYQQKLFMLRGKKKKRSKIRRADQVQVAQKKKISCLTEDGKICSSFPKEHSSKHKYQKPALHKPAFESLFQSSSTAYLSHVTGRRVMGEHILWSVLPGGMH